MFQRFAGADLCARRVRRAGGAREQRGGALGADRTAPWGGVRRSVTSSSRQLCSSPRQCASDTRFASPTCWDGSPACRAGRFGPDHRPHHRQQEPRRGVHPEPVQPGRPRRVDRYLSPDFVNHSAPSRSSESPVGIGKAPSCQGALRPQPGGPAPAAVQPIGHRDAETMAPAIWEAEWSADPTHGRW